MQVLAASRYGSTITVHLSTGERKHDGKMQRLFSEAATMRFCLRGELSACPEVSDDISYVFMIGDGCIIIEHIDGRPLD